MAKNIVSDRDNKFQIKLRNTEQNLYIKEKLDNKSLSQNWNS